MNREIYRAAISGNWETIKELSTDVHTQRTPNGNTILHVIAQSFDSSADAVKQITALEPDLVFQKNKHGETPLVIASRRGRSDIIRALIEWAKTASGAKSMAERMRAQDYNTALCEAVMNNQIEVVKLLLDEEGPAEFPYTLGRSPLYLAVEKGHVDIVALILSTSRSISYRAPNWRTALHAAALRNSPECMKLILDKLPYLIKKVDIFGWTALHCASWFNHTELVKLLLSRDGSLGYLGEETDDHMTALHMAVTRGHLDVIQEILLHCPDCWEMVTRKGKNILHLAVENEQKEVLEFILETYWSSELINKKDVEGSTPLHLYVSTKNLDGHKLLNHPCVDKNVLNNVLSTPLDIIVAKEADKVTERQ